VIILFDGGLLMFECRKCGRHNEGHYRFCLGCGASLAEQKDVETTKASSPLARLEETRPTSGAQACTGCGGQVSASDLFCRKCGVQVGATDEVSGQVVLVLIDPDGSEGFRQPLGPGETVIGRGSEGFHDDSHISPQHAKFTFDGEKLTVVDVGSTNGVFLRISSKVPLVDGTELRIGLESLRFEDPDSAERIIESVDDTVVHGSPRGDAWGRLTRIAAPGVASHAWLLSRTEVMVGREYGDITFAGDAFVSSRHARFTFDTDGAAVEDVGSSNGTFVRVDGPWLLDDGDVLLLGQQIVRVALR
jgi:pSer/pThr/pTyr-binding forkhead associated (FHA) protein/RNA polymerase subunit RPABC4/transcription elongation factor Spt4